MNLKVLLDAHRNNPRLFSLADRISFTQPQSIYLRNLHGSAPAFVIAAILQHEACSQLNHLVVCEDAESAAYLQNNLESLTGALDVFYFPSSFKNRKNFRLLNSSHVMLRTEALMKWSASSTGNVNKKVLVTYPEALFEKVIPPSTIAGNLISIKTSDVLQVDEVIEKLVNYGFTRTDFVYEPGQLALRGGILDIYSYGNEKPYRIELFGNDVDSIRIFDPETQLSERKLLQVNIIPNVESHFESEEKISLFDFLPENTICWFQDVELIKERLLTQEEDLQSYLDLQHDRGPLREEEEDKELKANVTLKDFINAADVESKLPLRHLIEFGLRPTIEHSMEIEFHTREQPAFNRQFDFLIRDLKSWAQKSFQLFIFAENPRQLERLHSIFEDLKAEIQFTPLPVSIHEGFIDEDLKLVCYTDHQIFQRYHKYRVKQAYNKNKALTLRTLKRITARRLCNAY